MGHININLNDIKNPFEPVPEGNYDLSCIDFSDKAAQSGDAMLTYTFEILDEEYAGKKVFARYMLEGPGAEFGLWRWRELMSAVGADLESPDPEAPVGEHVRAFLTVEPSNDEQYGDQNRISKIL